MEFKDKIMLHGFREVKCWWEVDERWKGNEMAKWEKRESGKVGRREVGWGGGKRCSNYDSALKSIVHVIKYANFINKLMPNL